MLEILENTPSWLKGDDNTVALYSSVRISRNYADLNFPSSSAYSSFRTAEKKTDEILNESIISRRIQKIPLSALPQESIIRLKKLRLLPEKKNEILTRLTIYHDRPSDTFLLLNYRDHLTFFSHSPGANINRAYVNCGEFLQLFRNDVFSKDSSGNYFTSGIDYFGSGMKCFSVITLPCLRLSGKIAEITSSLRYNGCSVTGFFGTKDDSMTIISNKDSYSKKPEKILSDFKKILSEMKKVSATALKEINSETGQLKQECLEIINSDTLTFQDFMRIYYILSVLRKIKNSGIKISELNRRLGAVMTDSVGFQEKGLKRSLVGDLTGSVNNEFNMRKRK